MARLRARITASKASQLSGMLSSQVSSSAASTPRPRRSQRLQTRTGSVASDVTFPFEGLPATKARKLREPDRDLSLVAEVDSDLGSQSADSKDGSQPAVSDKGSPEGLDERQIFADIPQSSVSSALTSKAEEIDVLKERAAELVDVLPDLIDVASKFLQQLIPKNVTREEIQNLAQDIGNKRPGMWQRKRTALSNISEAYTTDSFGGYGFIKPDLVVPALLDLGSIKSAPEATWRPDDLFYTSNIAELAIAMLSLKEGSKTAHDYVLNLDHIFPRPFMGAFFMEETPERVFVGHSRLRRETFDVALELRTQAFINIFSSQAETGHDFNPLDLAHEVFYVSKSSRMSRFSNGAESSVKGWTPGFGNENDVSQEFDWRELVAQRFLAIEEFIESLGETKKRGETCQVDVEGLRRLYPWTSMCTNIMQFIRSRADELADRISANGDVNHIVEGLQMQRQEQHQNVDFSADPVNDNFPIQNQESLRLLQRMSGKFPAALGQDRDSERVLDTSGPTPASGPRNVGAVDQSGRASTVDTDEDVIVVTTKQVTSIPSRSKTGPSATLPSKVLEKGASRTAGRSLLDPQVGASKVDPRHFDDIDDFNLGVSDSDGDEFHMQTVTASARKRRRIERESEVQQIDKRPRQTQPDTASKSNGTGQTASPSPSDVVDRTQTTPRAHMTSQHRDANYQDASQKEQSEDEQSVESDHVDVSGPPPSSNYPQAKAAAATRVLTRKEPKIQTRIPWDNREIDQLIRLVAIYGSGWAAIKAKDSRAGNILRLRDQTSIKHKAKLLKTDYLIGQSHLPEGFAKVLLDKNLIKKVNDNGIFYGQESTRKRH